MPIYEYRCDNGHELEVLQRMSEDSLTSCQECGAPAQRVLSAPAVHFKGSGFYATDYGKKGQDSSSSESNGGSGDAKTKKPAQPSSSSNTSTDSGSSSSASSD